MQSAVRCRLRHTPCRPTHRLFSTSTPRLDQYATTLDNLRIGSQTRVIFQGFTGRQATANAKESIAWGTNIVGGVTPGREGTHLDLPVLPSVRKAVEELKPDATGIYVPASAAVAAIEEAIEAEVPLIVAVAEHIPLHDMLRIHSMLKTQNRSRLVGPNSPGIISAAEGERCRIGFQPLPCFSAGCVGIAAKSGTLSYETVASTTRAGLGQSLCIGVGGDVLPGTDLVEALKVLTTDPKTKAIALIGEIGGDGEVLAAQWIRDYHNSTPQADRKPIVALVAGRQAPLDRVMGHAGAFWLPGEATAKQKVDALAAVGVTMVNHPAKFGEALKHRLGLNSEESFKANNVELQDGAQYSSRDSFTSASLGEKRAQQQPQQQHRRELHTSARTCLSSQARPTTLSSSRALQPQQTRSLHLDRSASIQLFKEGMSDATGKLLQLDQNPCRYLSLSMDRASRSQCITTGLIQSEGAWKVPAIFNKILLPSGRNDIMELDLQEFDKVCEAVINHLKIEATAEHDQPVRKTRGLLRDMAKVFKEKEAKVVSMQFGTLWHGGSTQHFVHDFRIELDDATLKSGGRLQDVHETYVAVEQRDPGAAEAEKDGIVYHRLNPASPLHNIGTLVNGAGLAMNTVDALADHGGLAANFLDTGGKATAETVRKSFEIILRDERVKVIFVNIFGGLTLGDMIARGIILAFKEVGIQVPVVVRIRGTNEAEGQKIIAESGLPLFAFDDFEQAAEKAIQLADEAEMKAGG
ncbi:hypothetical protein N0V93_003511 [Gnomoniopsis smithogilvyi]|uniref:CoA-binding domain-containing protein n=1 Tax=Gnomoniopsis smithogilvyi TaxID=1191159 RepID=A0A9W8YWT8_9PEZI|nr:hypothetical protein N0V93_003511 [Gnomoniopsis smithogilvyi]